MARRGRDPVDEFEQGDEDWLDDRGDEGDDDPLPSDQDDEDERDETLATDVCSRCGKLIVADVVRCPYCGEYAPALGRAPRPAWQKWTAIAIVLVFAGGLAWGYLW